MRQGLNREEVISLAKVMEIKFSVCGPPIGGAKSGIDFDPRDPRRDAVLQRWYKAVLPLLKSYYGTGGDLNVDELKDVIPITEDLGLWHPQEGIVNGHLNATKGERINAIGQLRYGCAKIVEDAAYIPDAPEKYAVADMITGWGVSESVVHYYDLFHGTDLTGKRVIVQGWGNVASAAALYLARNGAVIVGILDRHKAILSEHGLGLEEVKKLFIGKDGNQLDAPEAIPAEQALHSVWDMKADIFIPAAASKIVSRDQINRLIDNGLEVVSCGANVPFTDDQVFFGPTAKEADKRVSIIPDFIANCGMARVFAYLMQPEAAVTDKAIFEDVSDTIRRALVQVQQNSDGDKQLSTTALRLSLNQLLASEPAKAT